MPVSAPPVRSPDGAGLEAEGPLGRGWHSPDLAGLTIAFA